MRHMPGVGLFLVVLLLAAPGGAAVTDSCRDETGALTLTESQQWVRDPGSKAGNLAAAGLADYPFLADEAPSQSVSDGAGGGYLGSVVMPLAAGMDESLEWNEAGTATITGVTAGCLDRLAVALYLFPTTQSSLGNSETTAVRLLVGGHEIVATSFHDIPVVPNPGGEATYELKFALTDLLADIERAGLDPAEPHDLVLQVQPRLVVEVPTVYVWDTTEVPSNVRFNPADLTGHKVVD